MENQDTGIYNLSLIEAGYDEKSLRLEIKLLNTKTNAYTNLYSYDFDSLLEKRDKGNKRNWDQQEVGGKYWAEEIRGEEGYSYSTPELAIRAGFTPRCFDCGQWSDSKHNCPSVKVEKGFVRSRYNGATRWSKQELAVKRLDLPGSDNIKEYSIALPPIKEFRKAFESGPISFRIADFRGVEYRGVDNHINYDSYSVEGQAVVFKDSNGDIKLKRSDIDCTCDTRRDDTNCIHIDILEQLVIKRLNIPAPKATPIKKMVNPYLPRNRLSKKEN
jgi:hypothetical protein